MKKTIYHMKRVLALLLATVMLLAMVACDKENNPVDPSTDTVSPEGNTPSTDTTPSTDSTDADDDEKPSESQQPTPLPATAFVPTKDFVIVYGAAVASDPLIEETVNYLNTVMMCAYGFSLDHEDDSYDPTVGMMPNEYEILIGATNRRQSKLAAEELLNDDYIYSIPGKKTIVIYGASLAATKEAVKKFCADVIGYTGNGDIFSTPPVMTVGTSYTYRTYETVTINGVPLSDWTIGVNASLTDATALATELVDFFASYTGERMKTVASETLTGTESNVIAIGEIIGRSERSPYFRGNYYVSQSDENGSVISIHSTEAGGLRSLVERLRGEMTKEPQGKTLAFKIPEREEIHFAVEDYATVPEWNLRTETTTYLFEGVTYHEQIFYDEDGNPYHTYVLILDPDKVNFYMGSSNDGYDLAPMSSNRQTTKQHMQAAVANGKNIIAGVNANFFYINTDYSPKGLALKDGRLIHASSSPYSFFAITEDGEIIMDEGDTYNTYVANGKTFVEGVAGYHMILKDGLLTEPTYEPEQGPHPRTVVGMTADGKIILGVLDGRQANHSNGSGYARLALWMRSLGAVNAINLDGGGSSSFILRDPTANTYEVCNSPSDGSLRKVYNSLLVELKD